MFKKNITYFNIEKKKQKSNFIHQTFLERLAFMITDKDYKHSVTRIMYQLFFRYSHCSKKGTVDVGSTSSWT